MPPQGQQPNNLVGNGEVPNPVAPEVLAQTVEAVSEEQPSVASGAEKIAPTPEAQPTTANIETPKTTEAPVVVPEIPVQPTELESISAGAQEIVQEEKAGKLDLVAEANEIQKVGRMGGDPFEVNAKVIGWHDKNDDELKAA